MAAGSWDCWVPTTAIHMKSCDTSSRLAESAAEMERSGRPSTNGAMQGAPPPPRSQRNLLKTSAASTTSRPAATLCRGYLRMNQCELPCSHTICSQQLMTMFLGNSTEEQEKRRNRLHICAALRIQLRDRPTYRVCASGLLLICYQ